MTPLENAARALCLSQFEIDCYSDLEPEAQQLAQEHAAAVLRAVREPTPKMKDRGGFICSPCSDNPVRWRVLNTPERRFSEEYATEVWTAMINTALGED